MTFPLPRLFSARDENGRRFPDPGVRGRPMQGRPGGPGRPERAPRDAFRSPRPLRYMGIDAQVPPHLRRHEAPPVSGLVRHLQELRWMGATDDDLHAVIDAHIQNDLEPATAAAMAAADPGRGTVEEPVTPIDRAFALFQAANQANAAWRESLRGKSVIIAGEFPPHVMDDLLDEGIQLTQIHPLDHEGYPPPHFYHHEPRGLRGISSLQDLAAVPCDTVLLCGAAAGDQVRVSTLVPIVLRMFPEADVQLLEANDLAPHMTAAVPDSGFKRVPETL